MSDWDILPVRVKRYIAELDDIKSVPLGFLTPKPVFSYRLRDEPCTSSPDHTVGTLLINPIIIEDHHSELARQERMQNSFVKEIRDCNMLHQDTQSAVEGRLEIVGAQVDGQPVNSHIDHMLTRLQDYLSRDGRVHTKGNGAEEIIQSGNPKGKCSIKVTMKMPSTGGQQQANHKIDAITVKESKGRNKHKGKKPKVTFAQLLEKYQKMSEEKIAHRPSDSKASRSPPRRKSKDRYWQKGNFNASYSYPYFGQPIPISWIVPYASSYLYSSWDNYDSWAHYPYHSRPSNPNYADPNRSSLD